MCIVGLLCASYMFDVFSITTSVTSATRREAACNCQSTPPHFSVSIKMPRNITPPSYTSVLTSMELFIYEVQRVPPLWDRTRSRFHLPEKGKLPLTAVSVITDVSAGVTDVQWRPPTACWWKKIRSDSLSQATIAWWLLAVLAAYSWLTMSVRIEISHKIHPRGRFTHKSWSTEDES